MGTKSSDIPGSVRIRTDEGNEWRFDEIQKAKEFYERNRSDSIARACRDLPALVDSVQDVLERDDLSLQQRQEIAETLSTRYIDFDWSADREDGVSAEAKVE